MTEVANKHVRAIHAYSNRIGALKNENKVRDFTFTIDEPEKLGGTNEAPTPMEYILGSFNGCILIVIEMIAKEMKFSFNGFTAETTGEIDRRGFLGTAPVSPHFQHVINTVRFDTDESIETINLVKKQVEKRCPAYNLFKDAGIEIELNWKKEEEE
ncbi:OsmC family protein [Paraliobacillus quinghaiensis]|uniref:OsmC family protein n=1 Tax=Paraliobacillus quinghaiensis TaxID=470815 RepID=A0A917WYT4_9BACI|nr:OsmC family protein [Paraliobacillus quinghaiensis]GGM42039.1 OsmC family protein [Paraliobacillus quinghaiensis]